MKNSSLLVLYILLSGCAITGKGLTPNEVWSNTQTGDIIGNITLQWDGADRFIYIPDESNPLTFIRRKDGEEIDRITPDKRFYTDGGSIPRIAHVGENYSPWKFGPAYIIHDWLFELNHCSLPGHEKYNHLIAADIMAEVIKTQILAAEGETTSANSHNTVTPLFYIYRSVVNYSDTLWTKQEGRCDLVDTGL